MKQPRQLPLVIAGGLDDSPGTSISNAIEMVAAAVQASQFPDGREFRLVSHYPAAPSRPAFCLVEFQHRKLTEDARDAAHYAEHSVIIGRDDGQVAVGQGRAKPGDFRDPRWAPIDNIEALVGCEVRVWPPGEYTAQAAGGVEGERLRAELGARATQASHQLLDRLRDEP